MRSKNRRSGSKSAADSPFLDKRWSSRLIKTKETSRLSHRLPTYPSCLKRCRPVKQHSHEWSIRQTGCCQKLLPGYMIPSAYLPIRPLPLSKSYKLDRRVLKERKNQLAGNIKGPGDNFQQGAYTPGPTIDPKRGQTFAVSGPNYCTLRLTTSSA